MVTFEAAVKIVLENEGGFVDDIRDPGGATNYGISLRYLKSLFNISGNGDLDGDGDVDAYDIKGMTKEDAIRFYRYLWDKTPSKYACTQLLSTKIFDLSVNLGVRQAVKCLQRALNASGAALVDDGFAGQKTIYALQSTNEFLTLAALRSEAAGFYRALIASKHKFKKYKNGWLKRAYS